MNLTVLPFNHIGYCARRPTVVWPPCALLRLSRITTDSQFKEDHYTSDVHPLQVYVTECILFCHQWGVNSQQHIPLKANRLSQQSKRLVSHSASNSLLCMYSSQHAMGEFHIHATHFVLNTTSLHYYLRRNKESISNSRVKRSEPIGRRLCTITEPCKASISELKGQRARTKQPCTTIRIPCRTRTNLSSMTLVTLPDG